MVLMGTLLSPALGQSRDAGAKGKKNKPQLSFVCLSSLEPEQEVVLASRDAEGKWLEHGTIALRTSLITDWLPAATGDLHIALREAQTLRSIGQFQYPADARRALVVLNTNADKNAYEAMAIDPQKTGFVKGSVLILNLSAHSGSVMLGTKEEKVEAGQQLVINPTVEKNEMYRTMVSSLDASGKVVPCYDRYVSRNPHSRSMLFLLPDKTLALKVITLPLFGDFE
jgi:hypothetical protein